ATLIAIGAICLVLLSTLFSKGAVPVTAQSENGKDIKAFPIPAPGSVYRQTNFISDIPGFAPIQDPLLVNPWGISMTASSPFWVANNGTGNAQLIRGDVSGAPVVLNAAPQTMTISGNLPTGTVDNTTGSPFDFTLPVSCFTP